jgi:CRISPR-associated protein Csm3
LKLERAIHIRAVLHLTSGMRVGGSGGALEIGGVDLVAIRNPATGEPYVPGSSIKGRLRAMLEKAEGKAGGRNFDEPCGCGAKECLVCTVFGAHKNPAAACAPTRIIVRDASLTTAARAAFRARVLDGKPVLEEKTENVIHRRTGVAQHPRQQERVLWGEVEDGGAEFDIGIVLKVYEGDKKDDLVAFVRRGLGLVQEIGGIGAGESRGSGHVEFRNVTEHEIPIKELMV